MKKIPCETYSRVVGYFRPTRQWNKGKKSEFEDRKNFSVDKIEDSVNDNNRLSKTSNN